MTNVLAVIRENPMRYNRASELLERNEELKQAKKYFDEKAYEKEWQ